jgi:hypothetical protein
MMPIGMEVVEQPIYDTEDFGRIGQRIYLFARPYGAMATSIWREHTWTKDVWETNGTYILNSLDKRAGVKYI